MPGRSSEYAYVGPVVDIDGFANAARSAHDSLRQRAGAGLAGVPVTFRLALLMVACLADLATVGGCVGLLRNAQLRI